jgi:predicted acyltransferase
MVKECLISLDIFRGLTVLMMTIVNNPGNWSGIYPPLEHADWNGCTPTDLVFPFFHHGSSDPICTAFQYF